MYFMQAEVRRNFQPTTYVHVLYNLRGRVKDVVRTIIVVGGGGVDVAVGGGIKIITK